MDSAFGSNVLSFGRQYQHHAMTNIDLFTYNT